MREAVERYMVTSIMDTLEELCDCGELSRDNIFGTAMACDPRDGVMTFTSSVAIASEESTILVSHLANEAEQWIVGERTIGNTNFLIASSLDVSTEVCCNSYTFPDG